MECNQLANKCRQFLQFNTFKQIQCWNVINWPIDASNSCNSKHLDKFNVCSAVNWPIDAGNSFNSKHSDKFNVYNVVNWSMHVANSFSWEH